MTSVIAPEYKINGRYEMFSGVGQQQEIELWEYAVDKVGQYWFWPAPPHPECGSIVHNSEPIRGGRQVCQSQGYAGRTMTFNTKDGPIDIQGPWHSNSDSLFEATGVDVRDKHLTFGCIAKRRESVGNDTVLRDVLYLDPKEGVVGRFGRIDDMAKVIADELGTVVFTYSKSRGGSSNGPVYPSSWTSKQRHEFFYPPKAASMEKST